MPITKTKKGEILKDLATRLKDKASIVFVSFKGLSVAETNELRRTLRKDASGYTVVKKTLLRKTLGDLSFGGELPELAGELAVAYGPDPVMPAKSVADFRKTHEGKIDILGGVYEGAYMSKIDMNALAAIPGRHQLLGMLVNVINAPVQGLVIALDAISKKTVNN